MMLPTMGLKGIAQKIIELGTKYSDLTDQEQDTFFLYCSAWENRTNRPVTFVEFDIIKEIYGED